MTEQYTTTLRAYGKADIKLVKDLKKEFGCSSLSKCVIFMIKDYYQMKKQLDHIKKCIKVNYELDPGIARELIL